MEETTTGRGKGQGREEKVGRCGKNGVFVSLKHVLYQQVTAIARLFFSAPEIGSHYGAWHFRGTI